VPVLDLLGFAAGVSFAAGLNLYGTIAALGLLHRYGVFQLPSGLEALAHPVVIGAAIILYLVEFVADKIPYVDNVWDAVHTFIRPPAAAVLAWGAYAGVPAEWRLVAAMFGGSVALTAHSTKSSARVAANTSPEPFSNWVLSLGEDLLALAIVGLAATHPVLTLLIVAVLLGICVFLLVKLVHALRWVFRRFFRRDGTSPPGQPAPGFPKES